MDAVTQRACHCWRQSPQTVQHTTLNCATHNTELCSTQHWTVQHTTLNCAAHNTELCSTQHWTVQHTTTLFCGLGVNVLTHPKPTRWWSGWFREPRVHISLRDLRDLRAPSYSFGMRMKSVGTGCVTQRPINVRLKWKAKRRRKLAWKCKNKNKMWKYFHRHDRVAEVPLCFQFTLVIAQPCSSSLFTNEEQTKVGSWHRPCS